MITLRDMITKVENNEYTKEELKGLYNFMEHYYNNGNEATEDFWELASKVRERM